MNRLHTGLVAGALALWAASVAAQPSYPSRPIRLIVPIATGGPSEAAARALAKGLSGGLGQEVLVENRPGGNAGLGAGAVLSAAPDGYTLLFALASNAGPPRLPADIIERLAAAVRQATLTPEFKQEMERLLIVGATRSPAQTVELMQQAEAQYLQYVRDTGASID